VPALAEARILCSPVGDWEVPGGDAEVGVASRHSGRWVGGNL